MPRQFTLQFDPGRIPELVDRYSYRPDFEEARDAGLSITRGDYSRDNLIKIVRWKTNGRSVPKLDQDERKVAEALRRATEQATEGEAVEALLRLHGVGVPVASAILSVIAPCKYTIVDRRALAALGCSCAYHYHTVGNYIAYLEFCRALVEQHRVVLMRCRRDPDSLLRTLDRALWQSQEKPNC